MRHYALFRDNWQGEKAIDGQLGKPATQELKSEPMDSIGGLLLKSNFTENRAAE